MKVAEEMLYTGGNTWVLERIDVIDGKKVYFRLSDTGFAKSDISYDDVQLDIYNANEDYWEAGACNWENAGWQWDELVESGWLIIFNEMLDSWKAHERKLHVTRQAVPISDNYSAEIERIKMLKGYINNVDRQYDLGTEQSTEAWYDIDWTIGFAGMTITVKNCAAVYNAIQELIKEYEA